MYNYIILIKDTGMLNNLYSKCDNLSALLNTNLHISHFDTSLDKSWKILHLPTVSDFYFNSLVKKHKKKIEKDKEKNEEKDEGREEERNQVFLERDPFGLTYAIWNFKDNSDNLVILFGPFNTKRINEVELRFLANTLNLDGKSFELVKVFIGVVPFYDKETLIKILSVLSDYLEENESKKIKIKEFDWEEANLDQSLIEHAFDENSFVLENHTYEARLLRAVENGDINFVKDIMVRGTRFLNLPPRYPSDPLREMKNLAITSNSLCLRAAIKGGLDTTFAHDMSHSNAIRIEQENKESLLRELLVDIALGYTEAVHKYALKGYSELIINCINYIRRNLATNVSLHVLANHLHISKEHLSRQFKKEVGISLTDYIHKTKIMESQIFLSGKRYGISEIASMLSYSSAAHYSKVFKKHTGLAPSAWIKEQGK